MPAGSVIGVVGLILASRLVAARTALKSQIPRVLNLMATILLAGGIAVSGVATSGQAVDNISTYSNVFLVFFGTVLLLRLLPLVYYSVLGRFEAFKDVTNGTYYLADVLLMYFLNGFRFVLSLFDILTGLQAQLLFNTSYARQVSERLWVHALTCQGTTHCRCPNCVVCMARLTSDALVQRDPAGIPSTTQLLFGVSTSTGTRATSSTATPTSQALLLKQRLENVYDVYACMETSSTDSLCLTAANRSWLMLSWRTASCLG
jgi:hypothetical protein